MKKLLIILIFSPIVGLTQQLDSLYNIWKDKSKHDTIRLDAISGHIRKLLFSNPNKAISEGEEMLAFLKSKKYLKWQGGANALIGVAYEVKGDFQKAGEYYNEWKNILERTNEPEKLAMAYNNIGNIYWKQGDLLTALDYYQKSLKIRDRLNDKSGMASCYNNIGLIFSNQKEYDNALEYYKKAEKIFEEKDDKNNLISTYGNIGLTLLKLNKSETAMSYFQKSLKQAEIKNFKPGIAAAYNSIGAIYTDNGKYDKAEENFNKAIEINTELGNSKSLASTYYNLGNLEIKKSDFDKAAAYCEKGYDHAKKAKVLTEKMNNCECLYLAEKGRGDFTLSLSNYELFSAYRDSIASEDRRKEITRKEVRFEYEKKRTVDSIGYQIQKITLTNEVDKQKAYAELERLTSEKKTGQIDSLNKVSYIRNLEIKNQNAELLNAEKTKKLQQTEIDLKNKNLEQEKFQRYYLYGGLSIVFLFAVFVFNRFLVTRKQRNVISLQKKEVEHQKEIVDEKNNEILDSIFYAKHLQNAILPSMKTWLKLLPDSFVLYEPKDIVAGDFFFLETIVKNGNKHIIFAAADCTGHGVPGAMVSVVCSNALNRAVKEFNLIEPGEILNKVRELVIETFEKSENEVNDGMDISLVNLDLSSGKNLKWAGANNPLWIYRLDKSKNEHELIELKPDKQPIGKTFDATSFSTHEFIPEKGDTIYLFSDGYSDQFGGAKNKKYTASRFKQLLLSIQDLPMNEQKEKLLEAHLEWKGNNEQIDDVCIIGVKI